MYSFKFKAICSFKETIFIQQRCVRGHSRSIYYSTNEIFRVIEISLFNVEVDENLSGKVLERFCVIWAPSAGNWRMI